MAHIRDEPDIPFALENRAQTAAVSLANVRGLCLFSHTGEGFMSSEIHFIEFSARLQAQLARLTVHTLTDSVKPRIMQ